MNDDFIALLSLLTFSLSVTLILFTGALMSYDSINEFIIMGLVAIGLIGIMASTGTIFTMEEEK